MKIFQYVLDLGVNGFVLGEILINLPNGLIQIYPMADSLTFMCEVEISVKKRNKYISMRVLEGASHFTINNTPCICCLSNSQSVGMCMLNSFP